MSYKDLEEKARWFLQTGKVEAIGGGIFQVDKNIVAIKTKKGRSVVTCSCENNSRFCNTNPICAHIWSAILLESHRDLSNRIKFLKQEFEKGKELKFQYKAQIILDELEKLEKLI